MFHKWPPQFTVQPRVHQVLFSPHPRQDLLSLTFSSFPLPVQPWLCVRSLCSPRSMLRLQRGPLGAEIPLLRPPLQLASTALTPPLLSLVVSADQRSRGFFTTVTFSPPLPPTPPKPVCSGSLNPAFTTCDLTCSFCASFRGPSSPPPPLPLLPPDLWFRPAPQLLGALEWGLLSCQRLTSSQGAPHPPKQLPETAKKGRLFGNRMVVSST